MTKSTRLSINPDYARMGVKPMSEVWARQQEASAWEKFFGAALDAAVAQRRMTLERNTPVDEAPFAFEVAGHPALGRVVWTGSGYLAIDGVSGGDDDDDDVTVYVVMMPGAGSNYPVVEAEANLVRTIEGIGLVGFHYHDDGTTSLADLKIVVDSDQARSLQPA